MNHLQELFRSQEPAKIYLPRWVERLADLGITSTDPQVIRLHGSRISSRMPPRFAPVRS